MALSHRRRLALVAFLTSTAAALGQSPPGACVTVGANFNTLEGGCKDLVSDLVWSGLAGSLDWSGAMDYAANLVEAGYSDWRLPTIEEMQDAQAHGAYAHIAVLQGHLNPWSSSKVHPKSKGRYFDVWTMFWDTGEVVPEIRISRKYFNCVRQGLAAARRGGGTGLHAGSENRPGSAPPVTHVVDAGTWSVGIHLPRHAGAAFSALVTWAPATKAPQPAIAPLGAFDRATAVAGPAAVRLGVFDATGRASVEVDARALALPESVLRDLAIILVVAEPAGLATYRIRLPQ